MNALMQMGDVNTIVQILLEVELVLACLDTH